MGAKVEELMRQLAGAIREEVGALPVGVGTLGEEVERARASARMSLQDVADGSGLTKSHVWEIANGRSRNPTIAAVAGLARGLGVPFLQLAQAALNTALSTEPGDHIVAPATRAAQVAVKAPGTPSQLTEEEVG